MARGNCTVCDSPNATNLHFGAHACKACAAFFRRSIKTGQIYECIGGGVNCCEINHALRVNCRHCRFTKCLQAGMKEDLVQGKREVRSETKQATPDPVDYQPNCNSYYDAPTTSTSQFGPYEVFTSENEWDYVPATKVSKSSNDGIMEMDELQQFIKLPTPTKETTKLEEEERLYDLAAFYMEQLVNLNMRRRLTYTNISLATMFDGPCHCPYEKSDLKPFDHKSYRQKSRNEYTMILDYINRFPEFHLLNKSEKNVLFRTAVAVDTLVDHAYFAQVLFPNESIFVSAKGEFVEMELLSNPEFEGNSKDDSILKAMIPIIRRQWKHVVVPLKKLNMSFAEFALFKALTIWHYNYYKFQDTGRQICARQRDEIFRTLLIICKDEGHEDSLLRVSEIVLSVGIVMAEVHEMITSFIEIMVFDDVDDPILKDMLKFQY